MLKPITFFSKQKTGNPVRWFTARCKYPIESGGFFTIWKFIRLVSLLLVIALFTACSKEVEPDPFIPVDAYELHDIEYGTNTDTSATLQHLVLDIYSPAKTIRDQKFPLVLMIHGGSYQIGNKDWVSKLCEILADSGFFAVSMDYRLGWRLNGGCNGSTNTLEEAQYRGIQDANAALDFLLANTANYSIDPDWVFIGGESAGAAIALNTSYFNDYEMELKHPLLVTKLGKLQSSGQWVPNSVRIKGICNKWGAIADTNLINESCSIPVISFHGTDDPLVPADKGYFLDCTQVPAFGSISIYRRLQAANTACELHLKLGGVHQPEEYTPEFTMARTATFFRRIMAGNAESTIYWY